MSSNVIFYWLGERLRDAIRWPVMLVRYFPRRSRRLLDTVVWGLRGIGSRFLKLPASIRGGEIRPWLRRTAVRSAYGSYTFLSQLFDLTGGPELFQFVMHLGMVTSPLSETEVAVARSVLGPAAIRYGDVRVAQGGILRWIFNHNGDRAFCTWHTIHLSQTGQHRRDNLPILLHELTHVYQYEQVGSRYLGEAIYVQARHGRACYDYGDAHGLREAGLRGGRLRDYNREQQAQIAQHYYFYRERGDDTSAYEPFVNELRQGRF